MEDHKRHLNENFESQTNRKNSGGTGVIIFLSFLAVVLAIAGAFLLREVLQANYESKAKDLIVVQASTERDEMLKDLDRLALQFDSLSAGNVDLEEKLREERARVNNLRNQLRSGTGPVEDVAGLRAQIADLQAQVEAYRQQIELLQSEKTMLVSENSQIRSTLTQTTARNTQLETRNRELEGQLEKATALSISGLELTPIRARRRGDEPTDRAKRTDKMRICFTVNQNLLATTGNTDFYIRIVNPANAVMSMSMENTIVYQGETIQYSMQRTVNFQNAAQDVCAVWEQEEDFEPGYYNVVVFWDGIEVGYKLFELN